VIDCDVHNNLNSLSELGPWLDPTWRQYIESGGYGGFSLPNYPYVHPSGFFMGDAAPPSGGIPGSDYEHLKTQLLDAWDIDYAILNGEDILNISCIPNREFGTALAKAHNRWTLDVWLPRDERLRASIVVNVEDPEAAAREIQELADHPGVVQVLVPTGAHRGYGDRFYRPLFRAAAECGLPVAMHAGADGLGNNPPPTGAGYPSFYIEYHTLIFSSAMAHLVSLICNGVFEELPDLRFVSIETGVAWLPGVLWRLDANWKALRMEVPWIKELPSETVRRKVRFTSQPLEQPASLQKLRALLSVVDGMDEMLMFATDYPHWDVDVPAATGRKLPDGWSERVLHENARELYGLPAKAPVPVAAA
jgi:uncharacterized protein